MKKNVSSLVCLSLFVCAFNFIGGTAKAEVLSLDSGNKWHADVMQRFRNFEKLYAKSTSEAMKQNLALLREEKKKLELARDRRDRHLEFQGWADIEYYDMLIEECYGTSDWPACSKKLKAAGYPEDAIQKSGKIAADHEWKWVELRDQRQKMTSELETDSKFARLNSEHLNELRIMERLVSRGEADMKLDEVRIAVMNIYKILGNYKDLDDYFDKKFDLSLKKNQKKLCDLLKNCQATSKTR